MNGPRVTREMLTTKTTYEERVERLGLVTPDDEETINRLRARRQTLDHLLRDGGELWEWGETGT